MLSTSLKEGVGTGGCCLTGVKDWFRLTIEEGGVLFFGRIYSTEEAVIFTVAALVLIEIPEVSN
jgi:hypothetical protein